MKSFIVVAVFIICDLLQAHGQSFGSSCSYTRMTECKERLRRNTQKRINDMSRSDMMQHCGIAREDFNCLLSETRCITSDSERQRNADTIRDAYVYLRDGCDSLGENYRTSSCYIGTAMKDCENSKPFSSGTYTSYNTENCRDYNNFFKCVMRVLANQCRPEEDIFLGQYLVAKAQDLSWNCKDSDMDDRGRDWNRNRDSDRDRERDYGGRYGTDRNDRQNTERDRYRDRERDSYRPDSGYDRDRTRYSSDRYDRNNYGTSDVTCCQNEVCDRNRMMQCKDSVTRTVDNRGSVYQDARSCRKIRDDFNCFLWQTTCLPREERDRMSDIFHRARDYLSRQCDTHGSFSENSCYKSSEMQRCETYLSNTRNGASYESCSAYTYFRECMEDELRRRCTRDDQLYQGQYLVEKAQEMAWQCPNENSGSRSGYSSNNNYDRRPGYNSAAAFGAYNRDEPTHLDDEDEMCRSRMQSSYDICKRQLDEKRRLLITEHDYDVKQRETCCSARQFKTCLYDATRRVCHQERRRVVDSFLGRQQYELESDNCRRVYDYDCNSATSLASSSVLALLLVAVVSYIRQI